MEKTIMNIRSVDAKSLLQKPPTAIVSLRTPKEAAQFLKLSTSWLAKARMRGDGPPFIKIGRSVRYSEVALQQWMKSRQRLSTSEI
jgi:predicted DNA-binding transcriptional regulator AlpA